MTEGEENHCSDDRCEGGGEDEEESMNMVASETPEEGKIKTPNISFHTLRGHFVASNLRLQGNISRKTVTVLVDSGSTHNFVQTKVAKQWRLEVEPTYNLNVTIRDGSELNCEGRSSRVPLKLGEVEFKLDLFVLPIYGADVVLGAQWLAGLGIVTFNYQELWMKFNRQGRQITLRDIHNQGQLSLIGLGQLQKVARHDSQSTYYRLDLRRIEGEDEPTGNSNQDQKSNNQESTKIRQLLKKFQTVFEIPHGLPPRREIDHKIPLVSESSPVNVRPYRYPHYHKGEIERMISEMLKEGIIRPSSSPSSSPVLLVKK